MNIYFSVAGRRPTCSFLTRSCPSEHFAQRGAGYVRASGAGLVGGSYGGNSASGYPEDIWPLSYKTYNLGFSIGTPSLSQSKTNTVLFPYPSQVLSPNNPGLRRPGEY